MSGHGWSMEDQGAKKTDRFHRALDESWYAACESGHALWLGPDRAAYKDAQLDATVHDQGVHGGERNAVVLSY